MRSNEFHLPHIEGGGAISQVRCVYNRMRKAISHELACFRARARGEGSASLAVVTLIGAAIIDCNVVVILWNELEYLESSSMK